MGWGGISSSVPLSYPQTVAKGQGENRQFYYNAHLKFYTYISKLNKLHCIPELAGITWSTGWNISENKLVRDYLGINAKRNPLDG